MTQSDRVPALQVPSPEFKSQSHQKQTSKKKKKRILGDTNIQTMADLGDTNIQTMADRHHWDKWGNMNEFYRSTDGSIVPMLVS
jgi:hypothetical protein